MENGDRPLCTAFEGLRRVASGELSVVALKVKEIIDRPDHDPVLIFHDETCELIELDLRGTAEDCLKRVAEMPHHGKLDPEAHPLPNGPRGPGRPRLGVVAREVTLLPRHWDWLGSQPGGASVAIRKLVEEARRSGEAKDHVRLSRELAYRFMGALAGNLPGFEEATRALFAGNRERFDELVDSWPVGIRDHAKKLAAGSFHPVAGS